MRGHAARWLYAPAASDWILVAYLLTVVLGLALAEPGDARTRNLAVTSLVLVAFLGAVLLLRLRFAASRPLLTLGRLLAVPAMLLVYFRLRQILPLLNSSNFDEALCRLDVRLLGFEPTLALEKYSSRAVVEWFSFFYYSYFYFLGAWVLGVVLLERDARRQAWFAAGFLAVLGVGHFVYTLVPGFGPFAHLSSKFDYPVRGGTFHALVLSAVNARGPLRDIFPSIHTAAPTFCTLFAWRHYRRLAPVATFWTVNIIGATLVLRWHWAVDLLAGLALATAMFLLAPGLVEAYQRARARAGSSAAYW